MTQIPEKHNLETISDQSNEEWHTDSPNIITPDILKKDYQFSRLIGEGSNGKTWLAISRKDQKKVAVKALKILDNFKSIELFKREAAALFNIQTEGVPKFIEFVESPNAIDECYLIQEFFDFPSLQDMIDEYHDNDTTFSEEETLKIMNSIAEILDVLQTQYNPPVIHRDIKPSNILYDKLQNKAMLIDFGAVAAPAKKTDGSTIAGTQGFMAPEQMLGECTTQSDFYGLGATALYMLTGTSPVNMSYDKANPFLLKFDEIFKNTNISPATQKLIQSLMSPQVENRPQNTTELLDDIQQTIIDSANNPSFQIDKYNKLFENRFKIALITIGFIAVLAIYIYITKTYFKSILTISGICLGIVGLITIIMLIASNDKVRNYFERKKITSDDTLSCQSGYENHNMVIQNYLSDGTAQCVYYNQADKRYKSYCAKVTPGDTVKLQNGIVCNVIDGTKQFLRNC